MGDVRFWLSWYHKRRDGEFELDSPWWISGIDNRGHETICAAVIADSEMAARAMIVEAYDTPPKRLEWRFCNQREEGWNPFCDRFPRAKWMRWPAEEAKSNG